MKRAGQLHTSSPAPRRRRGASSFEYVMILAWVVIPLVIFISIPAVRILATYSGRVSQVIRLPF